MLWVKKIKTGAREIIKEHPFSICTFFVSCFILAILSYSYKLKFPKPLDDTLTFIRYFLLSITAAFFLCESSFKYNRMIGRIDSIKQIKKSFVYFIVVILGAAFSAVYALFQVLPYNSNLQLLGLSYSDIEDLFMRFFYVYLAICISTGLFFLYKKCGTSFENFSVKSFLGIMKGYLAYGVILLGALCIIWVFSLLIKDIDAVSFVMAIISGLMAYTTILMALSKPSVTISRFGNVMMGYVFPGLLSVAFAIVYVYIIKILVTWTFPSNEAFTIVTALFASGICIWTMAQGCMYGNYLKVLKFFPLLFIPFIVIQIMCLFMRVNQYGVTPSRYAGIMLIVFEILYEIYYILRLSKGKGLGGFLFPVIIAFTVAGLIVPGINVFATVTRSQKKVVEKVVEQVASGISVDDQDLARAKSAYNEIRNQGGLEGTVFIRVLENKYSEEKIDEFMYHELASYSDRHMCFSTENTWDVVDVSGFNSMSQVDMYSFEEEIDPASLELKSESGDTVLGKVDISSLISQMETNGNGAGYDSNLKEYIREPLEFKDGSRLYISYIYFEEDDYGKITELNLRGYYLY